MSFLVDKLIEETTTAAMVPTFVPGQAVMARQRGEDNDNDNEPTKKKKKVDGKVSKKSSLTDSLVVDGPFFDAEDEPLAATANSNSVDQGEAPSDQLFDPSLALVAPEATPNAEKPIQPTDLPEPKAASTDDPALDTILGKDETPAVEEVGVDDVIGEVETMQQANKPEVQTDDEALRALLGRDPYAQSESQEKTANAQLRRMYEYGMEIPANLLDGKAQPNAELVEQLKPQADLTSVVAGAMQPGEKMPEHTHRSFTDTLSKLNNL